MAHKRTAQRMNQSDVSGQALVEFTIFGSLALLALGFLIRIGLSSNYQQDIEQETFRLALQTAKSEGDTESQSTSYDRIRNRLIPDPGQPIASMTRIPTEAQSSAVWGEYLTFISDDREHHSRILLHLNDTPKKEFRAEDFQKIIVGVDDEKHDKNDTGHDKAKPTIDSIHKEVTVKDTSQVTQTNAKSTQHLDSTEDTTLTLNTKKNDQVTSHLTTTTDFNWSHSK